jgi:hypothetical protein
LATPKKQKHNPSALVLDLLFRTPKKAKTQPFCPPIGFAFLAAPPQKKLVPSNWICFLESHKKEKTQPFCNAQAQLLCLVLDLLFWRPKKSKNSLYDQVLA